MNINKRVIIYLHNRFDGDANEVMREMLECNLKFEKGELMRELEKIDENEYITFLDDEYPIEWVCDDIGTHPLVIKK